MYSILEVEVQLHWWPWSIDIRDESEDLIGRNIEFPFKGSPIITISKDAELFLSSRMERFRSLGCPIDTDREVYETPHGILTGPEDSKKLKVRSAKKVFDVSFNAQGAVGKSASLEVTLSTWSQVFDDLLDGAHNARGNYASEIMWSEVIDILESLKDESREPQMAVIVNISEKMSRRLPDIVLAARRILLRERELVPIHQIQESDTHCLRWYVRQPGKDLARKAGHKQRLLGVVRKASFNTLENQVLKDFLHRCRYEATRYLRGNVSGSRKIMVQGFKHICNTYALNPIFEGVRKPSPAVQPNYVLQNDSRYRELWNWYSKLLKRENEKDNLWDWQTRTWADVMRLLFGAALELLHRRKKDLTKIRDRFIFEPLVDSPFCLTMEQESGCRLVAASLPGPFQVTHIINGQHKEKMVIELIHPDLALQHQIVQRLGRVGGHLYMVIHPLGTNKIPKNILIFWSVNGVGVDGGINIKKMAGSAYKALLQHSNVLSRHLMGFSTLQGMIVASTLERGGLSFMKERNRLPVLEVNAETRTWRTAVDDLSSAIEGLLEQCYG